MGTSDLPLTQNDTSRFGVTAERLVAGKAPLVAAMRPEPHVFSPKTLIPREGWENKVCEIVSGWAVRRLAHSDGHDQIMSVLVPGDLFGVNELFSGPSLDSIETREMVSIRSIGYASVLSLAARDADVAMWLLYHVHQEISQYDNRLTLFARGSALEKVAVLLLDLQRRFSRGRSRSEEPVRVPLTQQDIADYSGLSLEYVSRTLAILYERGGVNVCYGAVEITDPGVLVESAPAMADLWVDKLDGKKPPFER